MQEVRKNYVLTTGTGSGKSLSYIVPIVDHVLRVGAGGRRIKAIVVYPMNALANSQEEELRKFLSHGYPDGRGPVTFRRFTGQEKEDEREEIRQNPPDIPRAPQPRAPSDDPAAKRQAREVPNASDSPVPEAGSLMADQGPLKGGELNAAITSALVGIHTEYLGRGPRSASTFHYGHVLVTLMHDVLTPAEKCLTRNDHAEAVDHIRHLFQETMEAEFREAVERLTGRKVLAFISGNHIDPDIAAELFILDGPP